MDFLYWKSNPVSSYLSLVSSLHCCGTVVDFPGYVLLLLRPPPPLSEEAGGKKTLFLFCYAPTKLDHIAAISPLSTIAVDLSLSLLKQGGSSHKWALRGCGAPSMHVVRREDNF